jgi:hypothetical protein
VRPYDGTVGNRRITVVLAAVLLAVSVAACSRVPDDPGPGPADFIERDAAPPSPVSISPTPPQKGVEVSGCPSGAEVLAAFAGSGAAAEADRLGTDGPPVCAGDWTAATVTSPDADSLFVILRTRDGRLYSVAHGTWLCDGPELRPAPPSIRAAVRC